MNTSEQYQKIVRRTINDVAAEEGIDLIAMREDRSPMGDLVYTAASELRAAECALARHCMNVVDRADITLVRLATGRSDDVNGLGELQAEGIGLDAAAGRVDACRRTFRNIAVAYRAVRALDTEEHADLSATTPVEPAGEAPSEVHAAEAVDARGERARSRRRA